MGCIETDGFQRDELKHATAAASLSPDLAAEALPLLA